MRRGLLCGLLFSCCAILASDHFALAQGKKSPSKDGVVEDWGMPSGFAGAKDLSNGYWIWHQKGMWHFRTTGGGKGSPNFKGRIDVIGGKFDKIEGLQGEYKGKLGDRYVYNKDRNAMLFDFKTDQGIDGLNFSLTDDAKELKFNLVINGQPDVRVIRLGKDGDNPPEGTFTVPAHPPEPTKGTKGKGKK